MKEIIECQSCDLSLIDYNITTEQNPHFGKLLPKLCKECKYFIVGLNPSKIRYKGSGLTVYGDNNIKGSKINEFTQVLKYLEIFDECYITNLVKCSTENNIVKEEDCRICFKTHLKRELQLVNPKIVIALGEQVFKFLSIRLEQEVVKIKHPSWYYSYGRGTMDNEILEIKTILKL